MVAAPPGWEEPSILLAEELGAGKVTACVTGGETRTDSVRIALAEVPEAAAVVLVHDAARPLLPAELVGRLLTPLGEGWDGAVPGLPLADTVKRLRGDTVVETLDRTELAAIQTPQAFVASTFRAAMARGPEAFTDCAAAVEAAGGRIKVVAGDPRLVKVTTPDDLATVDRWLQAEREPARPPRLDRHPK